MNPRDILSLAVTTGPHERVDCRSFKQKELSRSTLGEIGTKETVEWMVRGGSGNNGKVTSAKATTYSEHREIEIGGGEGVELQAKPNKTKGSKGAADACGGQ